MQKNLYVVIDKVAETVMGQLLAFPNDTTAVRYFADVASQKDTIVSKHLQDYELRRVGSIDERTGQISAIINGAGELGTDLVITGIQVRAIIDVSN